MSVATAPTSATSRAVPSSAHSSGPRTTVPMTMSPEPSRVSMYVSAATTARPSPMPSARRGSSDANRAGSGGRPATVERLGRVVDEVQAVTDAGDLEQPLDARRPPNYREVEAVGLGAPPGGDARGARREADEGVQPGGVKERNPSQVEHERPVPRLARPPDPAHRRDV